MPNNKCPTSLYNINLLRVIGKYLAILPPECCINSEEGTYSLNGFYKWYTISVLVFIIIGYSLSVWGRFKEIYNTFPSNTLVVTDIGLNVSAIITNILSITLPSMVYLKQYGTFFKTFQDLDMHFTENGPEMKRHRFYTFFAVTHILFISLSLYNAYIWNTSYGFVVYRYYIFENIQNYHIFIMVITIFILTRAIAQRFKRINTALEELTLNSKIYVRSLHCNADLTKWELFETVRQLSTFYEKQIAQVHLFNEVFGWQILFLSLYIIMGLLNALDILILFGSLDLSEVGNGIHVDELTGINILWACWQFSLGITVVIFCCKATSEAQSTSDVCVKLLLNLPPIIENKYEKALKDELMLLNNVAMNRSPSFSAAGFFNINYSILLAILSSVTSYVIVLVQFNKA